MNIDFTKAMPDELYINSFKAGKTLSLTYNGPKLLYVLVDKELGGIQSVLETETDPFNKDLYKVVIVDAEATPDVAHYVTNTTYPARVFEDETLVGGVVYKKITNPTLRDIYSLNYNIADNSWTWSVIERNPKSVLNDLADRYRNYVNANITKVSSDAPTLAIANNYLKALNDFETTGKGSIPSWKFIQINLADVPMVPQELIVAFNALP